MRRGHHEPTGFEGVSQQFEQGDVGVFPVRTGIDPKFCFPERTSCGQRDRLVKLFKKWAGRPPRFARYTSRTPYAGVRSSKKDGAKLQSFDDFYVEIERRAFGDDEAQREEALLLLQALKERGKWPAKPDLSAWFGTKGARWQDKTGAFIRAVTLPDDSELLTRHEVQAAPPDLLVTNYSMLEYMLMRPIERTIFDRTREWLANNPAEKFLVVLDEAHLYSVRDSLRPMIAWGFERLQSVPILRSNLSFEDLYLAVLLASKKLNVRLRPEMKFGENFNAEIIVENAIVSGETEDDAGLLNLCMELRNERPPEALLDNIITSIRDRFLGFEALALASVVERAKHTAALEKLPDIPGFAETSEAKIGLARAWLRCWQGHGFWLSAMPLVWYRRPRSEGTSVRGQKGKFKAMDVVVNDKAAAKLFWDQWAPTLASLFTEETEGGFRRLRGSELSLKFDGDWVHCGKCKSVHRPVPSLAHCLDCGSLEVKPLDPTSDPVFLARKGFYRKPVVEALPPLQRQPMALVAAEHTAQLNAPQNDDVFSKAEENELLFQDIKLSANSRSTAIDVLSSTTTMEVGIDLGALSGVALRNMPPGRANYQQRAGRAGRRGNAVATVVAFGSADSHDEHYFSNPDGMIRGPVVDPKLTLGNLEIVRRHVRAFLLQSYHQDRLPEFDPSQSPNLFSVLGSVSEFRNGTSPLNRDDFAAWLQEHDTELRQRIDGWAPEELSSEDRETLLAGMIQDCLREIDDAIRPGPGEADPPSEDDDDEDGADEAPEVDEEQPRQGTRPGKLLDRLLYAGALPRYAFPTDVATFHVFDRDRSTRFRPIMRFVPSQSLPVALSQYAPGKQVWISGKCYTSGAIYSVMSDDRKDAWDARRLYMECSECGFARTFEYGEADRGEIRDCEACGGESTFGPARNWLRPPGFAHPENEEEVTSPDDVPETSIATRAKLTMGTDENTPWVASRFSAEHPDKDCRSRYLHRPDRSSLAKDRLAGMIMAVM